MVEDFTKELELLEVIWVGSMVRSDLLCLLSVWSLRHSLAICGLAMLAMVILLDLSWMAFRKPI